MYNELAKYYDLIYSWKDYKKESNRLEHFINRYKKSDGKDLLEAACGTANYSMHLRKRFRCEGFDLSEDMLKIARKKLPGIRFRRANMINFDFKKRYDVIICMFSSIGYVRTYSNLKKTIANFSRHLKPGGVLIIQPWFSKGEYKAGSPHGSFYRSDDVVIARANLSAIKKGNLSVLDMHHLIAERGRKVRHVVTREVLAMFDSKKVLDIMSKNGLESRLVKNWFSARGYSTERGFS